MSRLIDADALIADCQLAQKQADRHGREFANAFYSGGGEISTEWWCVEDMIENAPTVEERKTGRWLRTGRTNVFGGFEVECSNCHDTVMITHLEDESFCRHCGAKMEGCEA